MLRTSFICVAILACSSVHAFKLAKAGCSFSLNGDVNDKLPLLIDPEGSGAYSFHQPVDNEGTILLDEGQVIELSCPGGTVQLGGSSTGESTLPAVCLSGQNLEVDSKSVSIHSIACNKYPFHTARFTGNPCLETHKEIEIGFETSSRFIPVIHTCFDEENQNTLYSTYDLPKTIGGYQSGFPRPDFIEDDFYDTGSRSVENLYTRNTQRTTINSLLGLSSSDQKYIGNDDYFLSRGHCTAKADFVYGSNQRATFHYVNVVPQWQTFNGANWNQLEQDVRSFASDQQLDLVVYTGSYNVTKLPHSKSGELVPLYLYVNGDKRGLPVPQLMYKVVYHPETKAGIAFVGVNNPYDEDVEDDVVCTDICEQVDWLHWKNDDLAKGFAYCCSVQELSEAIDTLPKLDVDGVLTSFKL